MFRSYYNPTTLHDVLMNTLLGFVLLFTVALLMISPVKKKADIETKAEFVITVTWPKGNPCDVDTWLEDPAGKIAHFRQKDVGLMHLDRDDLGSLNDTVYVNGVKIEYPYNQEITSIRGFIPGEWVLNIHLYGKHDWAGPVKVTVRIDKLNPTNKTVFIREITLRDPGQEETVTRFNMTADGAIIRWDDTPKTLIQTAPMTQYYDGGHRGGT